MAPSMGSFFPYLLEKPSFLGPFVPRPILVGPFVKGPYVKGPFVKGPNVRPPLSVSHMDWKIGSIFQSVCIIALNLIEGSSYWFGLDFC